MELEASAALSLGDPSAFLSGPPAAQTEPVELWEPEPLDAHGQPIRRRWKRRKINPFVIQRPRRKSGVVDEEHGTYTTWIHMDVMAWLLWKGRVNEQVALTPAGIAKGVGIPVRTVRKVLTTLATRGVTQKFVPRQRHTVKDGKRLYHKDIWVLSVAGERHFVAESRARLLTSRFDRFTRRDRWYNNWRDINTIRRDIIPAFKKCGLTAAGDRVGGREIYRIDWLVRVRSVPYLMNLVERAPKMNNPAAYIVTSCTGSEFEANLRRARSVIPHRWLFQKHPELTAMVVDHFGSGKVAWVDAFNAFQTCYPFMEAVCKMEGFTIHSVMKGVALAFKAPYPPKLFKNAA